MGSKSDLSEDDIVKILKHGEVFGEQHLIDSPQKPSPVEGDLIEKALALLTGGHNLNTFGIGQEEE